MQTNIDKVQQHQANLGFNNTQMAALLHVERETFQRWIAKKYCPAIYAEFAEMVDTYRPKTLLGVIKP